MANLVTVEIRVKGTKTACETVYKTQNFAEVYTADTVKKGRNYYITITGECKWSIDSRTRDDITLEEFNASKISKDDMKIIENMSLRAKSELLKCEIEAIEYFDEDDSISHYRYKNGEVLLYERAFVDSLSGFVFDKEELNFSVMLSLGEDSEDIIHIQPEISKEDLVVEDDLSNYIIENDVLKRYKGKASIVNIPEGVKGISDRAFCQNNDIVEIYMPDSLQWIGSYVFESCLNLSKVCLKNPDVRLEEDPFCDCNKLWQGNYKIAGCFLLEYKGKDKEVIVPDGIQVIGWCAFNNTKVQRVVLPKSVTQIEGYAFSNCKELEEIIIPYENCVIGEGAFQGCDKLVGDSEFVIQGSSLFEYKGSGKQVVVPNGVTTISTRVFSRNEVLESVVLPASLVEIGDYAFEGCINLKQLVLPANVSVIGKGAFSGTSISEIIIPAGVSNIAWHCFQRCKELAKVRLSENTTTIDAGAFEGCEKLEEITFPTSLEAIGYNAFSGCSLFRSITIPENVKRVEKDAFNNCKELAELIIQSEDTIVVPGAFSKCEKLKDSNGFVIINNSLEGYFGQEEDISIPEGIIVIAQGVFTGSKITSVTLPNTLRRISPFAFNGSSIVEIHFNEGLETIGDYAFERTKKLSELVFPSTLESIGRSAFADCGLTSISFNGGPKVLGDMAFSGNEALKRIILSEGIEQIGEYTFNKCKNLASIEIPSTVKQIGRSAFSYCGIKRIEIKEGVEQIGSDAFSDNTELIDFIMPDSITSLGRTILRDCKSLSRVRISGGINVIDEDTIHGDPWGDGSDRLTCIIIAPGVKEIEKRAITSCKELKEIHIPETVMKIKKNAFEGCPKVTIFGKAKSVAQKYAKKENIPFMEE